MYLNNYDHLKFLIVVPDVIDLFDDYIYLIHVEVVLFPLSLVHIIVYNLWTRYYLNKEDDDDANKRIEDVNSGINT